MSFITRKIILDTLAQHGALSFDEMVQVDRIGFVPDQHQLKFLLQQLVINEQVKKSEEFGVTNYQLTTSPV